MVHTVIFKKLSLADMCVNRFFGCLVLTYKKNIKKLCRGGCFWESKEEFWYVRLGKV